VAGSGLAGPLYRPIRPLFLWPGQVSGQTKTTIVLHDKFDSWQQFKDKLDAYCEENCQIFVKDGSKTVEFVNKHRRVPFLPELLFAFMRQSCHYVFIMLHTPTCCY